VTTETTDLTELFVAVGRIEEKLNHMSDRENKTNERLDKIDNRLSTLELNMAKNVKPKTPWWVIVGGLAGVGSVVTFIIFILNILVQMSETLG